MSSVHAKAVWKTSGLANGDSGTRVFWGEGNGDGDGYAERDVYGEGSGNGDEDFGVGEGNGGNLEEYGDWGENLIHDFMERYGGGFGSGTSNGYALIEGDCFGYDPEAITLDKFLYLRYTLGLDL